MSDEKNRVRALRDDRKTADVERYKKLLIDYTNAHRIVGPCRESGIIHVDK